MRRHQSDSFHEEVNGMLLGTSASSGGHLNSSTNSRGGRSGGGGGDHQHQPLDVATIMEDPVTLMLMLNKHKESLNLTLREINALKAVIQGQEQAIAKLQSEKSSLLEQVRVAKETEFELVQQIQHLSETCDELTSSIQRKGMENAARLNAIESSKRESEIAGRTLVDRLNVQLVSTQNPISSARPMPWSRVQTLDGHPAHVLREVVLGDARREESLMSRAMTVQPEDDYLFKLQENSRPPATGSTLDSDGAHVDARNSEDEANWRMVCARVYNLLVDRRKWLATAHDQSPMEFLLRTRSQLVGEACHMHQVVQRCSTLVAVLFDRLESVVASSGGQAIGGQLELISATVADMDTTLHRIKLHCFSTADCTFHGVKPLGVGPTPFTVGRPLLPGGQQQQREESSTTQRTVTPKRAKRANTNDDGRSTPVDRLRPSIKKNVNFGESLLLDASGSKTSPPQSPSLKAANPNARSTSFASAANSSFANPIKGSDGNSPTPSPVILPEATNSAPRPRSNTLAGPAGRQNY